MDPAIHELLYTAKRRKLDSDAEAAGNGARDAAFFTPSAPPAALSVDAVFDWVKSGFPTDAAPPATFTIKSPDSLPHHPSIQSDAYITIFKAFIAAHALNRNEQTLRNSQATRGPRGKWTCLFKKVRSDTCRWPAEGKDGQHACEWCMRYRRPCIVVVDGNMAVLPLAPSMRQGCSSDERAFCVLPDEAKDRKPAFLG
jgi:hypothetical protein